MKIKIKAINLAAGLEISREGDMIFLEGHFWKGIRTKRDLPNVLMKLLIGIKKLAAHFRAQIIITAKIPATVLQSGLAQPKKGIFCDKEISCEIGDEKVWIRFAKNMVEGELIRLAYVYFYPPIDNYNLVVVLEDDLMEALKRILP